MRALYLRLWSLCHRVGRGARASLLVRLLAIVTLGVAAALSTVAVVARWSTEMEFQAYVAGNQAEMQAVAREVATRTGKRLVVENVQGQVVLDSSAPRPAPAPPPLAPPQTASPPFEPATPGSAQNAGGPLEPVAPGSAQNGGGLVGYVTPGSGQIGGGAVEDGGADVVYVRQMVQPVQVTDPPAVSAVRVLFLDSGLASAPAAGEFAVAGTALNIDHPVSRQIINAPEELFIRAFDRSLLIGVLVGGAVAIALAVFFARRILRPVKALTAAAQLLEQGDLTQRVTVGSYDEIGRLGQAFNAMAQRLHRTEQLRRAMVADVAHELRTPLTNLQGYLEAVRDGLVNPDAAVVSSLYDEALLLNRLVDDVRDLALSDAGQLTLHRELIPAADLVLPAIQAVRPRALALGISLSASVTADLPAVRVDRERIGQVLRNLLDNALAHTSPGGSILVSASVDGATFRLCVRDSGAGIEAVHLPYVFERFYRADPSRTRATGGAGIGLAVAKELVEAHGGRITVDSTPAEGSAFSVDLPVCLHAAESVASIGTGATDSAQVAVHARPGSSVCT